MSQRKYALDIVAETGMLGSKSAPIPMVQHHRLGSSSGSPHLAEPEKYRRLVGRLIYLNITRPDLAYAVHILSQFMQAPCEEHWVTALRVVRYLKETVGQGILLTSDSYLHLVVYYDSDWTACPMTRR